MENIEIMLDGQKTEIVIRLSEELKDDYILENDLDSTLDLEEIMSITKEIKINNE